MATESDEVDEPSIALVLQPGYEYRMGFPRDESLGWVQGSF